MQKQNTPPYIKYLDSVILLNNKISLINSYERSTRRSGEFSKT
jgi:hypothetical protein